MQKIQEEFIYALKESTPFTASIFTELMLAQQLFVNTMPNFMKIQHTA
jgi:hypothetical protein